LKDNIPTSFSKLTKLSILNIGNNLLSGEVPSFLRAFSDLKRLNIRHNHYTFDGIETLAQSNNLDLFAYEKERIIDIHQTNNTLSVYAGGTLSNNTYKWFKDGVLTATINGDSTYTLTNSGDYTVQVTNSIATALTLYSDTVTFTALTASQQYNIASTQTSKNNNFSIYPNPAKTNTIIAYNATGNCVITITDASGRVIQTKTVTAVEGRNILQLDVSKYAAGVYFVTLSNEKNETQTLRFSKQ
jgi:hypothetical protein